MTRIDFYVLSGIAEHERQTTACRLAEKAYRLGHRCYIQTASIQEGETLDDLLWTFRQNSFLPHERWTGQEDSGSPIWIGHSGPPDFLSEVLINLADPVPDRFDRFSRVAEIINQDETTRSAGRRRYRFYRDRGLNPMTHHLGTAGDGSD